MSFGKPCGRGSHLSLEAAPSFAYITVVVKIITFKNRPRGFSDARSTSIGVVATSFQAVCAVAYTIQLKWQRKINFESTEVLCIIGGFHNLSDPCYDHPITVAMVSDLQSVISPHNLDDTSAVASNHTKHHGVRASEYLRLIYSVRLYLPVYVGHHLDSRRRKVKTDSCICLPFLCDVYPKFYHEKGSAVSFPRQLVKRICLLMKSSL